MSDIKLYRVGGAEPVAMLERSASKLEKDLQKVIETNMELMFGVRLLASEFSTGPVHGGRMDSIGIDDAGTPVIFEYKRTIGENVMNQGLFYLDWLLDHQGDFTVLVIEKFGAEAAATIDFSRPRLICVANSFTKYDEHAIRQMGRAIELIRYQQFEGDLLALELFASSTTGPSSVLPAATPNQGESGATNPGVGSKYSTFEEQLAKSPQHIRDLYADLTEKIESLGDDVSAKATKYYMNFRRIKSFASVEIYSQRQKILVFVRVDPATVNLEAGFSRDVTNIGHLGNGELELTVTSADTLARALPLIQSSYEAN
ncbi:DUF5655 domain-containing protein [Aeromicrobium sp. P5_D10]